ncbi:MAG: ATP synthase F1 subunit delta [Candidatus Obscuribacterales bacterium]|nr:ATP synthase F1 subunit delta [Candidatus Obscuribacterales bacterium]
MKGDLQGVACQYAEAMLELVEESAKSESESELEKLERILNDLQAISELFKSNPDLAIILNHPFLSPHDKKEFLVKTFEGKAEDLTLRLFRLLADRRRLEILPELHEPFARLLREKKNIVSAQLYCSRSLNASQLADIKARLSEHLGKKLELDVQVDESLIAGLLLRLGDQVMDGSLKGQLASIEKTLLSV